MTTTRVLFWHRRDLRLADNLALAAAAEISPAVTGVYVLDPAADKPAGASAADGAGPAVVPDREPAGTAAALA